MTEDRVREIVREELAQAKTDAQELTSQAAEQGLKAAFEKIAERVSND